MRRSPGRGSPSPSRRSSRSGRFALLAVRGVPSLYDMGVFFTKAAFLTIGGAYAVLPYVYQGPSSTSAG